jgi:hypothetical protein
VTRIMNRPVHVMFNPSGAGSLKQALKLAGRDEEVVTCFDNLSFGPINPPSPALRAVWADKGLGCEGWEEFSATIEPFMSKSLNPDVRPLVWYSRRDTLSFCGFLEWLWRRGERPCEVMDVTDLSLPGINGHPSRLVVSPSVINPNQFIKHDLLDNSKLLSAEDRSRFQALWNDLKEENSSLRVLTAAGLVSAPISYFDSLILSFATDSWWKMAKLVGYVLVDFMDNNIHQTGDILIAARIQALAEAGKLEWRGDLYEMQKCEVRLPGG